MIGSNFNNLIFIISKAPFLINILNIVTINIFAVRCNIFGVKLQGGNAAIIPESYAKHFRKPRAYK